MTQFKVSLKHLHAILVTYNKETKKSTINYDVKPIFDWEDAKTTKVITKLKNTPHYKMLLNPNTNTYEKYMTTGGIYVGYGIEHSVDIYKDLIKSFKGYPHLNEYITCKIINKKICIIDGLHRANILLFNGNDKVSIILENGDFYKKQLRIKKQLKLKQQQHMKEEFQKLRIKVTKNIKKMNDNINLKSHEDELLSLLRGTVEKQKYNAWKNNGKLQSGYHSYNTFGLDLQGQRNCSTRVNDIMKYYSFENKNILDVGCNTGGMLFHIENIGHGFGVDYDKNCIAFATRLGELVNKDTYTFEVFDFDKRNLKNLNTIINKPINTVILCSLGSWVKKWEQLYQYCYNLKADIIFETNNDTEGEPQLKFWRDRKMNIKLIIDNSKDDITGNNRRKTYLLTH